jgi:outer membrane receptor for ferric coprogen and ferric-rhodotorulic acid
MEDLNSGYNLFDFRFKYNLQKDFTLGILCENLLNNDYIIRPANMGSPRTVMLQIQRKF